MRRRKIACFMLITLLLTGCKSALPVSYDALQSEDGFTSMESQPDLSYEVPQSSPHIYINQLGYITESTKTAIFCGEEMPEEFHVISAETGEVIYKGQLEYNGNDPDAAEKVGYGDFSEVEDAGEYYIEASLLGRSYSFSIGDDLYDASFAEAIKQFYYNRCGITLTEEFAADKAHNACHTGKAVLREDISVSMDVSGGWHQDENGSKDVIKASSNIGIMLLAYELFGIAYTDDVGIPESENQIPDILDEMKFEIEWLQKMQNAETGAVYSGVTVVNSENGRNTTVYVEPASLEASKAFAMVLAKFSYLYQNYDKEYATICLKSADRAWKYAVLNQQGDEGPDSLEFAAAAELYRASGLKECRDYVDKWLAKGIYKESMDTPLFLGCVTYLSTKQPVNRGYCAEITRKIMSDAEEISARAKASPLGVDCNEEQTNHLELLQDMMLLATVNHIITNHEYETIIENHLHYFMGRNKLAISYIDDVGARNYKEYNESLGIMKQFEADSKLIFILSEIVSSY